MVARTTHPDHRVFSTIDMAPSKDSTLRAKAYMRLPCILRLKRLNFNSIPEHLALRAMLGTQIRSALLWIQEGLERFQRC
ncbi:MAG: hypothetical protein VR64_15750 [Desulfatitalea sp. BRH_c12]|nr:MAG: hypothetical protein VR64_15750 [Desulfatitalea sp. BRH_c12]